MVGLGGEGVEWGVGRVWAWESKIRETAERAEQRRIGRITC